MKLLNKRTIITGGSRGFGREVAEHFVREGASVVICSRGEAELSAAVGELSAKSVGGAVFGTRCDTSDISAVKAFVGFALEKLGGIDVLVNNAGVYGPMGFVDDVDLDKWAKAFSVNVMGPLYMCHEVIPIMRRQKSGRVINLSGGGATKPMPGVSSYAATKTAVVRLTETIAGEVANDNIFVNAIAPGALNTRMLDEMLAEGKGRVSDEIWKQVLAQKENGGTPLATGASLCVYLASDESAGVTGKLISAVWDDWKNMHKHAEKLKSDIYTLRRVMPEDRGVTL